MKKLSFIAIALITLIGCTHKVHQRNYISLLSLDSDWRFFRGDNPGAEKPDFDDSHWRNVDVPHDYSIEDIPGTHSPFDSLAVGGVSSGYTLGGTAWYRKILILPKNAKDKTYILQFDGVYMNANVYLNGNLLGNHPYGYTSFWFDISNKLNFTGQNILAVEVQNEGKTSRWYSGSGIYRHVWLRITGKQHVAQWGTAITTPEINENRARINIKSKIENASEAGVTIKLINKIFNPIGKLVVGDTTSQSIGGASHVTINTNFEINKPELWDLEACKQYRAVTEVYCNNMLTDSVENFFGIRSISFDAQTGFQLNGKTIKLKGGCVHHDNGPLGAKAYDRAEERRIEKLKESGFNAVRCAHNPPSPAFLQACDKLGMLVIDEAFDCWNWGKNPQDYHLYFNEWWKKDIESMVNRDFNHPSIIMWSIGNEIPAMEDSITVRYAHLLASFVKTVDISRPVTAAVHDVNIKKDPFFSALDVAGYNYVFRTENQYLTDHKRKPDRVMFCSESYPIDAFKYWKAVEDYPWVIGDFVWTGIDNIGEASIGWLGYPQGNYFPWNLAFCGDLDICLWKRPQSYYRNVLWHNGKQLSIFVRPPVPSFPETNPKPAKWSRWYWHDVVADWNWPGFEGKRLHVEVYSGYEAVELFLNGVSLGKKLTNRGNEFIACWEVPYAEGKLTAIGYKAGKKIAQAELVSSGKTSRISLIPDRKEIKADGEDLCYIEVNLTDQNGIVNPKANNTVKFEIAGSGTIVGVGNANPKSLESFQRPQRKAWRGRCLVIIKSDKKCGEIILKANVEGLTPSIVKIKTLS